jgi:hypothetical protein
MSINRIIEVTKKGHTHLVKFDLEATYKMDEFRDFVTMKESKLKISKRTLEHKFGADLYLHLDLAYNLLKEVANSDE